MTINDKQSKRVKEDLRKSEKNGFIVKARCVGTTKAEQRKNAFNRGSII